MPRAERGPFPHGTFQLRGGDSPKTLQPGTSVDVWSYRKGTREVFHMDVHWGRVYVGHLTFTYRGRRKRGTPASRREGE